MNHLGCIDQNHTWSNIRDRWVDSFRNREVISGESVSRKVSADYEWCAEAYMETDYSTLSISDFEKEVRKYVAFRVLHAEDSGEEA